jgi:hypothetical protein
MLNPNAHISQRVQRIAVWTVLIGSILWCSWRGVFMLGPKVWVPQDRQKDMIIFYAGARAWLTGHDPYDGAALARWWDLTSGAPANSRVNLAVQLNPAPPTTLLFYLPFALLSVGGALVMWHLVALALVATQIVATIKLAGHQWPETRALLLASAVLLLAPLHLAISTGQPALLAGAAMVLGVVCAVRKRDWQAGLLFGLAAACKTQLALPFTVMYACLRRWRLVTVAGVTVAVLALIAVGGLALGQTGWVGHWRSNIEVVFRPGETNDYSALSPARDHLINLQLLICAFTNNRTAIELESLAIGSELAIVFLLLVVRWANRGEPDELLCAAALAPLCLLPVYHRYYDAIILTLTLAWAAREWDRARAARMICIVILAVFFQPAWLMERFAWLLPRAIVHSPIWDVFLLPHRVWALLLITCILLRQLARRESVVEETQPTPVPSPQAQLISPT